MSITIERAAIAGRSVFGIYSLHGSFQVLLANLARNAGDLVFALCESGNSPGAPQLANGAVIGLGVQESNRVESRLPTAEDEVEPRALPLSRRHYDVEFGELFASFGEHLCRHAVFIVSAKDHRHHVDHATLDAMVDQPFLTGVGQRNGFVSFVDTAERNVGNFQTFGLKLMADGQSLLQALLILGAGRPVGI